MQFPSLAHLSDEEVSRTLDAKLAGERTSTIDALPSIAEYDARRLFLPAGFNSMYAYCVHKLRLSEDSALKRIRAARAAQRFPAIFPALAEGRLHLTGVSMLAKYLKPENADELVAAAANKTCAEIQLLIAERFPQPDRSTRIQALAQGVSPGNNLPAARPVDVTTNGHCAPDLAPREVAVPAPQAKTTPLAPGRFAFQGTMPQRMHDKLEYLRALLGHQIPSGDRMEVLEHALDLAIAQVEKKKFGATARPRPQRSSADPRHIPAAVKQAVWKRDDGQCTFASEREQRCGSRAKLEFDHIDPVACGGDATVEGIRLRCRAHNQYEAECTFGAGFMAHKREAAQQAREEAKARAVFENDPDRSVIPWLRRLGYRLQEAREAALICERMNGAPMEEKIRAALRSFPLRTVSAGHLS